MGRLAALSAACVAYGFWEARHFVVRRREVPILPPGSAPLRLLHVSDIHLMARQRYKTDFIRALAGLEPDLVVTTGDNWSEAAALEPLMRAWGRLRDVPGAFVFGSNDYEEPSFRPPLMYLVRSTEGTGDSKRPLPVDELHRTAYRERLGGRQHLRAQVRVRGLTFEFRGTDDAHLGRDDYSLVAGPPSADADVSIGVTHAPYLRVLNAMTTDGVDLIPGRPHPRRPGLRALLRRPGHQLRPGHHPRQGPLHPHRRRPDGPPARLSRHGIVPVRHLPIRLPTRGNRAHPGASDSNG